LQHQQHQAEQYPVVVIKRVKKFHQLFPDLAIDSRTISATPPTPPITPVASTGSMNTLLFCEVPICANASTYFCATKQLIACTSPAAMASDTIRSEEHTSELQSRENLVCRLLLEKKKITTLLM